MTFQQVSVAETLSTRSFQIDSACWNYLELPSFSKFQSTETVWSFGHRRIPHCRTCWNLEFQDWNYAETIRIRKFQNSFSGVSAMLKRYLCHFFLTDVSIDQYVNFLCVFYPLAKGLGYEIDNTLDKNHTRPKTIGNFLFPHI